MMNSPSDRNPTTFAERLRESFEQMRSEAGPTLPGDLAPTEAALANCSWDEIAHAHRHSFNSVDLDGQYAAVVRSYQFGNRHIWSALLLEMLAPALCERSDRFFSTMGTVGMDDIKQQLVLEILRVAAGIDLTAAPRYVDHMLVREASRRVGRWLRRLNHRHESLEQHPEAMAPDGRDDLAELEDLCGGEVVNEDVQLVYRFHIRREPLRRLAREKGMSEEAVLTRIRRARDRLRKHFGEEAVARPDRAA